MRIACVRDEIQVVTLTGVESHSMLSTRARSSSLCWKEVGRTRTPWRRLRSQQSPQLPRTTRQSPRQGTQTIQEVPVPVMQLVMQIVERPLGLLEVIIDKELERSCVERSEL